MAPTIPRLDIAHHAAGVVTYRFQNKCFLPPKPTILFVDVAIKMEIRFITEPYLSHIEGSVVDAAL